MFLKQPQPLANYKKNSVASYVLSIKLSVVFLPFFCEKLLKENRRAVLLESSEEGCESSERILCHGSPLNE